MIDYKLISDIATGISVACAGISSGLMLRHYLKSRKRKAVVETRDVRLYDRAYPEASSGDQQVSDSLSATGSVQELYAYEVLMINGTTLSVEAHTVSISCVDSSGPFYVFCRKGVMICILREQTVDRVITSYVQVRGPAAPPPAPVRRILS